MKEKTKYYYLNVPDGYFAKKIIDAKDKKTVIVLNLIVFLIAAAIGVLFYFIKPVSFKEILEDNIRTRLIVELILIGLLFAYIILHELTHGLVYKIFTHEKLKFGVTLSVAFCGVPNAYVKKWPAFLAAIAPLVVYSILFLTIFFASSNMYIHLLAYILFIVHFSGCAGDIWVCGYLLFKADKSTIVNDDGAKQVFYEYSDEVAKRIREQKINEVFFDEGNVSTESSRY